MHVMANPLAVLVNSNLAGLRTDCDARPALAYSPQSKSAAILGGEMSALDRIKNQQSAQGAPKNAALSAPATGFSGANRLEPSASGVRQMLAACAVSNISGKAQNPEHFLASKRVRIGKTNFDSEWRRVGNEGLSATFQRAFGGNLKQSRSTIAQVNRWVNREIRYVEDRDLFGRADYWAGARLTMSLKKGDCEDIALTKMQLLAAAGFSRDDMYLSIVRDTVRNADHALLVVRIGDGFVVLDNATDTVLDGAYSHDYAPVISFNEKSAWLHGY